MKQVKLNQEVSGYLILIDEMPVVGYALQAMLDRERMNIQVIQLYTLDELINIRESIDNRAVAIVADLIWSDNYYKNKRRIFALELLFPDCPVLIFSNAVDKKLFKEKGEKMQTVVAILNKLDDENELFDAIINTLKHPGGKKVYISTIVADYIKRAD